jgi:hypothetical protein
MTRCWTLCAQEDSNFDRIINLDPEIPHCALDLSVPEEELNGAPAWR